MNRVVLVRRGGADVEARETAVDGTTVEVTRFLTEALAAFVREREATPVRWVWDDTTRWYPALLEAGAAATSNASDTKAILRRTGSRITWRGCTK